MYLCLVRTGDGLHRYVSTPRHAQNECHDMQSGKTTCRLVKCILLLYIRCRILNFMTRLKYAILAKELTNEVPNPPATRL